MGDDIPEACCAAGICCDMAKQKVALTKYLEHAVKGISHPVAEKCAEAIQKGFTLVPKGLIDDFIKFVQDHPYE